MTMCATGPVSHLAAIGSEAASGQETKDVPSAPWMSFSKGYSKLMQLTKNSHYNPCFWTAHWNTDFLEATLKGNGNHRVAREQMVYALNVKSNTIRKTSVVDVHYDKGVGIAEISPEAALDFCKRTQPDKYDEYREYYKQHPETVVLDVEAILTGLEETEAYATLKRVLVKGRIDGQLEKALLAGFIAVHRARSHAVLNSMMQLHKEAGLHWFESVFDNEALSRQPQHVV
jgi:hypothetical protein